MPETTESRAPPHRSRGPGQNRCVFFANDVATTYLRRCELENNDIIPPMKAPERPGAHWREVTRSGNPGTEHEPQLSRATFGSSVSFRCGALGFASSAALRFEFASRPHCVSRVGRNSPSGSLDFPPVISALRFPCVAPVGSGSL